MAALARRQERELRTWLYGESTRASSLRSALRDEASQSLRFASAVAGYADLLRGGGNVGDWGWNDVATTARGSLGQDRWGLRGEFVDLVESARQVTSPVPAPVAIAVD